MSLSNSRYQAERLLRTEIARAQIQAQAKNYNSLDIDEYEYIACGLKDCCPICKELDGKRFKVKDMECGKNAPPMHPNCHCATAPHYDSKSFYEWLDARQSGKTTLGLNEWKHKDLLLDFKNNQEGLYEYLNYIDRVYKNDGVNYRLDDTLEWNEKSSLYKKDSYMYRWASNINESQADSISKYTYTWDKKINSALRSGKKLNKTLEKLVNGLDSVISSFELSDDVTVYRGINLFRNFTKGEFFKDEGYMSTSFTHGFDTEFQNATMIIKVPKGKGYGAYIKNYSNYKKEEEFLLSRGTELYIDDVTKKGEHTYITATVTGNDVII